MFKLVKSKEKSKQIFILKNKINSIMSNNPVLFVFKREKKIPLKVRALSDLIPSGNGFLDCEHNIE